MRNPSLSLRVATKTGNALTVLPAETDHSVDDLPLCVDLDGTLVRVDTLHEAAIAVVLSDWRLLFRLPGWLARGKAHLKQQLASRWCFEPAGLPYNRALLAYLETEHARGRYIVLATAADQHAAEAIANHCRIFDEVIASDGIRNLRGQTKAAALCRRFGTKGFVYAGNDATDHAVWHEAAAAVVVNAPGAVRRAAEKRHRVSATIDDRPNKARALLKAIRPYQWVKNLLTVVPLLSSGMFADPAAWWRTLLVFCAFCSVASGVYILNDIADLAADRQHPRKSKRPFASGALSITEGLALLLPLLAFGLFVGWKSGALLTLIAYGLTSLWYSLKLKEMPLVDVFVLAGLYTIRLFAGGQASGHIVSLWLLGFSVFLFLSLALIKRVSELIKLAERHQQVSRRGYSAQDLTILQMMGCAATFASALVLSLYVQSDIASRTYAQPWMLWGVIPLMLFWQCRLWLSTARGYMHDDPIVYAARDWVSWLVLLGLIGLSATAYVPVGFGL